MPCAIFFVPGCNLKCFASSSPPLRGPTDLDLEMPDAGSRLSVWGSLSKSTAQGRWKRHRNGSHKHLVAWNEPEGKWNEKERALVGVVLFCFIRDFFWEKWSHQIEHIQKRNDGMILMYTVMVADFDDHVMGDICVEGRLNIYWIHPRPVKEANEGF